MGCKATQKQPLRNHSIRFVYILATGWHYGTNWLLCCLPYTSLEFPVAVCRHTQSWKLL